MEPGEIIKLQRNDEYRGSITIAEGLKNIPFQFARAYWICDVPAGESRGGHAHISCKECIIAASGSFEVTLDNGTERKTYRLYHPWEALFVDRGIWRTLDDFSSGAVCLVLASELYDSDDYISDYSEFLQFVSGI